MFNYLSVRPIFQKILCVFFAVCGGSSFRVFADIRIRQGYELCTEEREYIKNRSVRTHKACEALLHKKINKNQTPCVALCFSGGGMRSAILSLGCLKAAEQTGLLDCCRYIAALSGSTWSVAATTVLAGCRANPENAVEEYASFLRTNLNIKKPLDLLTQERAQEFFDYLTPRMLSGERVSALEVYGWFLTMLLMPELDGNRFTATLSQTHACVKDGRVAMPIYTAVETSESQYRWAEWTPFETGIADDINTYIPVNAFGARFENGRVSKPAEKTLGYCLALFGSAFALTPKDFVLHLSDALLAKISAPYVIKLAVRALLEIAAKELCEQYPDSVAPEIIGRRLFAATVPNYCYGTKSCPLHDRENLTFVDGGIAFNNLPLVALLNPERRVDVIIVYDASSNVTHAPALAAAETYAFERGIPFPAIDYTDIEKRPVSVFPGRDSYTPTIIYLPRLADADTAEDVTDPEACLHDGSCSTMRFRYTPQEFDALLNVSYGMFKKQLPVFKKAIADKIIINNF